MKNKVIALLLAMLIIMPKLEAQNKKPADNNNSIAGAVVAVAGAALIGGLVFNGVDQYQELLESSATEHYLGMGNEGLFNIKLLLSEGASTKKLSKTNVQVFGITDREIDEETKKESIKNRKIMTVFNTNDAWINEYGIKWDQVDIKLWDEEEWFDLYLSYASMASPFESLDLDSVPVMKKTKQQDYIDYNGFKYELRTKKNGGLDYYIQTKDMIQGKPQSASLKRKTHQITNKGIIVTYGSEVTLDMVPFYYLDNDSYLVNDYNKDFKLVYNENSLGLYLKEAEELVQLKTSMLNVITSFFWTEKYN